MKNMKLYAIIITLLLIIFGCEVNTYESNLPNDSIEIIDEQNRNEVDDVIDNNEEETEDAIVVEEHSKDSPVGDFGYTPEDIEEMFPGYSYVERDGGELSGYREPNVVVNIGFGQKRNYFAFTNKYGQLVRVVADKIVLQDDDTEPVLKTGRYYRDEAKVPGVESNDLDEGHV
jgi:hypothetical protein